MSEVMNGQPDVPSTASLHEQGLALARDRRFEAAMDCFQQVLQADPTRIEAIRHLAQACGDGGQLPGWTMGSGTVGRNGP
jgi:Flp pilus assembly protein TadD